MLSLLLTFALSIPAQALSIEDVILANRGSHPGHLEGATPLDCEIFGFTPGDVQDDPDGFWLKAHYGVGIFIARYPVDGEHWVFQPKKNRILFYMDDPADFFTFQFDPTTLSVKRFFKTTEGLVLRPCAID